MRYSKCGKCSGRCYFCCNRAEFVAGSRLLVEESIKDEFVWRLVERVQTIKIGLPHEMATEFGPLCTLRQRQKLSKSLQVQSSKVQNAYRW